MINHIKRPIKRLCKVLYFDPYLLVLTGITLFFGLMFLYSAGGNSFTVPMKQFIRICIGFVCMFIMARIPPHKLAKLSPYLYILGLCLLIIVFFTGHIGKGAQRWLNLGIINFEPSEVMKIALPLCIANYLKDKRLPISTSAIIGALGLIIIPVMITLKQPDLGTAILQYFACK